jgi:hypothetical protein
MILALAFAALFFLLAIWFAAHGDIYRAGLLLAATLFMCVLAGGRRART